MITANKKHNDVFLFSLRFTADFNRIENEFVISLTGVKKKLAFSRFLQVAQFYPPKILQIAQIEETHFLAIDYIESSHINHFVEQI